MSGESAPAWLVPGAKVLVFRDGQHGASAREATVEKVNRVTFRVSGDTLSFDVVTLRRRGGSQWDTATEVAALDSERARAVLARAHARNARDAAARAVDAWRRNPSRDTRLAAIAALQAVED